MGINLPSGKLRIAITIVVGIGAIAYGGYTLTTQSSALDSPEMVDATIVSTSIEEVGTRGPEYVPHATFNYTYGGETYTSSNVYPAGLQKEFGSEEDARAVLDGYEAGETVRAYLPPNSPGTAYLIQRSSNKPYLAIGSGVFFVLVGLVSALTDRDPTRIFSFNRWV